MALDKLPFLRISEPNRLEINGYDCCPSNRAFVSRSKRRTLCALSRQCSQGWDNPGLRRPIAWPRTQSGSHLRLEQYATIMNKSLSILVAEDEPNDVFLFKRAFS